jgi:PBSX family phage terminase large subunit
MEERYLRPFGAKAYAIAYTHPRDDKKITLLEGAVRSAKTWALIPKIINLCNYAVRGLRIFTGVTKSSVKNNILNDLFEIIGANNYGYNNQSGELDLFGVPWLVIGAKDEGSEKIIRGSTVGINVADELTLQAVSFWKMVQNRMSVEGARMYATTNPDTPFHPVYTDLMMNEALIRRGELHHVHFELSDNPNLPDGYREYLNAIYPPGSLYHQRFVKGLWVTGEGAIYKDVWSEELLYDDEPWTMSDGRAGALAPPRLRALENIVERTVAVDCGVDHVQVYGDFIDDGKTYWMDNEYWWDSKVTGRQKTERQYSEDLEEFLKKAPGALTVIPPEQASFDNELIQRGIWHTDADNEVLDGIKHLSILMSLKRIKFHRKKAANTVRQLQTYVWDAKASLRGIEQPLKQQDDGPDMVRYFAKTRIPIWRLQ